MSRTTPRYVLHSGYVTSKTDGDQHFLGARQLARLYGVPWEQCIVVEGDRAAGYSEQPGDVHLYPRYDGDYKPPE